MQMCFLLCYPAYPWCWIEAKAKQVTLIREKVEYLGHMVTPEGLKINSRLIATAAEFPRPQSLSEIRRFLGFSSYYHWFVSKFSKIVSPLQALTQKGIEFKWSSECETAFQTLKEKLTLAPVLAYPSFEKPFVLRTDARTTGIGAVLSQPQKDGL